MKKLTVKMKKLSLIIFFAALFIRLFAGDLNSGISGLIRKLGASTWNEREDAQKKLIAELEKEDGSVNPGQLISVLKTESDPEIYFRLKDILAEFYFSKIFDPDKKPGFIGLQLAQAPEMKIEDTAYLPIEIVKPQPGFPGEKAGIKAGDLLIAVDDMKCSDQFTLKDFILYIADLSPGTEVTLTLFSEKKIVKKKIKLAARPESMMSPDFKKDKKESFKLWLRKQLR
jgi:C-terminal processing protease CtpA/Prc